MHLQQTKSGSIRSGGPQYFFHDLPHFIKEHLRSRGVCEVILETPYGIALSPFMAVGRDHKLDVNGKICHGRVGHDRIQAAKATESIGEAIRRWYALPVSESFERIDVDARVDNRGRFVLTPLKVFLRNRKRGFDLQHTHRPLSIFSGYSSPAWQNQIAALWDAHPDNMKWAMEEIVRVVGQHNDPAIRDVNEVDLLRAAGALSIMGVKLGPYSVRHYDCSRTTFLFAPFPAYACPVEIKKESKGFEYQIERYKPLLRVVVLCVRHNLVNLPEDVDVIELSALADRLAAVTNGRRLTS